MVKLMMLGDGTGRVWCVDFGAQTRWHVLNGLQLNFLMNAGIQWVVGDQAPGVLAGFRTITPAV